VKRKILSGAIYATTAFALAQFFDALYAGEPVTDHLGLIYLAIAGTILFAAACILSLFTVRVGVVCGLGGGVLSWPAFAIAIPTIPWGSVVSIFPYANWPFLLTAILALVVSSVYSVNRLRVLVRGRDDLEEPYMGLKLAVALSYSMGIFVLTNWRSIWDWLFRLRYGN
jgi:hypothetical protein